MDQPVMQPGAPTAPEGSPSAPAGGPDRFTALRRKTVDFAVKLKSALLLDQTDKAVWANISTFPSMNMIMKVIIVLLNVVLPGFGTMAMALFAYKQLSKTQLAIGLLQFASAWLLIGYIWSILWGVLVLLKSPPESKPLGQPGEPQTYNQEPVAPVNPWEVPHHGP